MRRRLVIVLLAVIVAGNALSVVAGSFPVLMGARFVAASRTGRISPWPCCPRRRCPRPRSAGGRLADWNVERSLVLCVGLLCVSLLAFYFASTAVVPAIVTFMFIGVFGMAL